jgi:acetylglutamate kinase
LGDTGWVAAFAAEVALSSSPLVIIHGGGPEIDELSVRLGVTVERKGGLRVTSPAGLEVAAMVLNGVLNKRLVTALLDAGVDALGLSGEDGALLMAGLAEGGALGRVGEVLMVRTELLSNLLSLGLTPVISPISRGADGGPLNVNADDVAVAVACALGAEECLFLTDVSAVRDRVGEIEVLDAAEASSLLAAGVIADGMAVKVGAGLRGLDAGLDAVRIGGLAMLTDSSAGTLLRLHSGSGAGVAAGVVA